MDFLYLSPHFDDVALSCGGMVLHNARRREAVTVLTVCAGAPDYTALSAFARVQHRQWRLAAQRDPIAERCAEDAEAMRRLGASAAYLDIPDAVYRRDARGRPIVFSNRTLFGRVHPDERALVRRIAREVIAHVPRKRETLIIAPLAAGRHVDHQLVRDAARLLALERYHVAWYEDFPYAEKRGAVGRARKAFGESAWSCAVYPIDVAAKIEAIAAYASQLKSTFKGPRDMARRVRAYHRAVAGGRGYAERLWHLDADMLSAG